MNTYRSYTPNYFSLPDILATHEKVPCKFEVGVKQLGFLDRGSSSRDIEVGASIELPLWLVKSFFMTRVRIASITLPPAYSEVQRDILSADECVIDLHKQYFYEFGMHLSHLPIREAPDVTAMLLQAFKARFRRIMDWAMHSLHDVPHGVRRLDQSEERIYNVSKEAAMRLNNWLAEGDDLIEVGKMVIGHQKRQSGLKSINFDL